MQVASDNGYHNLAHMLRDHGATSSETGLCLTTDVTQIEEVFLMFSLTFSPLLKLHLVFIYTKVTLGKRDFVVSPKICPLQGDFLITMFRYILPPRLQKKQI